jgi:hypothetical protein
MNQIIAGEKAKAGSAMTAAYHQLQKPAPLAGVSRTYRLKDEEGETLPAESTRVQYSVDQAIQDIRGTLARLFDVTATKEYGNTQAKGNVVVGGLILLADVPATYLLFLEKQLVDLHTFVAKLPVLDPSESWRRDENTGHHATESVQTKRTKKIPRNHVLSEATDRHPAQVQVYHEDMVVGYWTTVKFSGAIPATRQAELLHGVEELQRAVKFARGEANAREVEDVKAGEKVLAYIFG